MSAETSRSAEVAAFERRLRRAGIRRQQEPGDRELAAVLQQIDTRRGRRSGAVPLPAAEASGSVLSIERVGADIRILRVTPPPGFGFRAGQYVKVGLGTGKRRSFSLASAPYEAHLELCIALNPGGRLTPALFALHPGARLDIDPRPRGHFGLAPSARRHLMVATGTGIAPLRSMVRDARHRGSDDEFLILHGASNPEGLPYREELEALAASARPVTYLPAVSRPESAGPEVWSGRTGRVDALALDVARSLNRRDTHAYVCGNPGMVASVTAALSRDGFSVSREAFD